MSVSHNRGRHEPERWSRHAVAGAVALATTLVATNAWSLALGRITLQSRLGEPLRAEIDLPSITAEEADSLQAGVAPTAAFQAASMEYNPLLQDVTLSLQRRADGRPVLRLSSQRAVTEPFLDLVVQAQWASGKLVRGYTLLLDPPNLRQAASPQTPAIAPAPAGDATPATAPAITAPAARTPATASQSASTVRVSRGDTAAQIALAHKPLGASLDQMLIGMLRANPNAFVGRNVNRLKAGVVLQMPDESAVAEIPAAQARQQVAAQSRDFNEYRRRLAAAAPVQATEVTGRQSRGTVQSTEVKTEETKPATPDKLTLSKGSVASTGNQEDKLAEQRRQEDSGQRSAELKRNLDELRQLSTAANPSSASPQGSTTQPEKPPVPGVAVETPAAVAPATEPPAPPAAPEPAAPAPAAPPPPAPAPGLLDGLSQNLLLPAGGAIVAALLGALAWLRLRKRKATTPPASEVDDSRFEAFGGQTVDTSEDAPVSSMMYSPSQLDAAGDVDPVAEADVYLAYGRDKQAEEILLEALRLHPERLPLRLKLLEIYAQRNDPAAFAAAATPLHELTQGSGPDWEQARDMGYALDPGNPLYQPAGAASGPAWDEVSSAPAEAQPASTAPEVDLDLGFRPPAPQEAPAEVSPVETAEPALDLDLDLNMPAPTEVTAPAPAVDQGLDFDLDLSEMEPAPAAEANPSAADAGAPHTLPPEVQDLSLDFDLSTPAPTEATAVEEPDFDALSNLEVTEGPDNANPLETKLSLAREFEAIGDTEGARSLAEEVATEASGELQERARAFLSQLS